MPDLTENAGGRLILQAEDEDGQISSTALGSIESSLGSGEVFGQLRAWAKHDGNGRALDGTVVYTLASGAKMSPAASWVRRSILDKYGKNALSKVAGVVVTPVFVVEMRAPGDGLKEQIKKCERWIKAGVEEVWLVDPIERNVYVFRSGRDMGIVVNPRGVDSAVLAGFTLECGPIWED